MKRYTIHLLTMLVIGALFIACQKSDNYFQKNKAKVSSEPTNLYHSTTNSRSISLSTEPYSVDLLAGQNILAGSVEILQDGNDLIISYYTSNGYGLEEVHLWVGDNLEDMPQNRHGNPRIGQFPYKAEDLNGATFYQFIIPISDFGVLSDICYNSFYVAAHAALVKDSGDGSYDTETGWAAGDNLVENGNWATYFSFMFSCDTKEDPDANCETGFAYGPMSFVDLDISDRWGWVIEIEKQGNYFTPIYTGASNNDINRATLAGKLYYYYDGTKLFVTYEMVPGYTMNETHLYASTDPPMETAPGSYGNLHDLDHESSDEYVIELDGMPIYIIAHAVVCNEIH